ncbi:MAG: cache domain-containing protein, partial [Chloroflexi bacterium]|nr:cache domain-containing protein [Chloroflexota bacterium]
MDFSSTSPAPPKPVTIPMRAAGSSPGRSLRTRWRLFMLAGMNVLMVIVLAGVTMITLIDQRRSINRLHESAARHSQAAIQAAERDTIARLAYAGQTNTAESLNDSAALRTWVSQLDLYPALRSISVVAADGVEIAHTPPTPDRVVPNWSEHPAWIAITSGETEGRPARVLMPGDPPVLAVAVALGGGPAVLVADLDPQALWQAALAPGAGDKGIIYLVDSSGRRLAVDPQAKIDEASDPAGFAIFEAARDGEPQTRL